MIKSVGTRRVCEHPFQRMKAATKTKSRKRKAAEPPFFMYKGVKHYIGRVPPGKGNIPLKTIEAIMDDIVAARKKPVLPP